MIPFVKAHACGNDFLVIEEAVAPRDHAALARRLCARSTGIGADGIEFLDRARPTDGAEFFLRLFNADGSEAELSGNGTRCVAAWLAKSEGRMTTTFGTHGGRRSCTVIEDASPVYRIESAMGVPRVMPRTIVLPEIGEVAGAMVNVGNPHFVVFVNDAVAKGGIADEVAANDLLTNDLLTMNDLLTTDLMMTNLLTTDLLTNDLLTNGGTLSDADFASHGLSWQALGERISLSPLFSHGTNVEFVRVLSPSQIAFRIFERGCGPTTSSGTGTCASSAAAISLRGAARTLTAIAQGGAQQIVWPSAAEEMRLTGPAEILCIGEAL